MEGHSPGFAIAVDLDIEALCQGVDYGGSHAVEPPGGGVGASPKLSPGMKLGEHKLESGETCSWLNVDRDSSSLVAHLHASIGVNFDRDVGSVAPDRLIDRVVNKLPQAVHEPARVGRPDVHTRALTNCFEPFQNSQMPGGVIR
jgi:hypothetical protein